jgi:hypothetical protein
MTKYIEGKIIPPPMFGVALRSERADVDADALVAHARAAVDLEGFRSVRTNVLLDHGTGAYDRGLIDRCRA